MTQNGNGYQPFSEDTVAEFGALLAELRAMVEVAQRPAWTDANGIAEHLCVDSKTVQNRTGPNVRVEDRIPFHRLPGGEKRFHVPEVDEWLLGRAA